jgi:hypothetical protein
LTAPSAVARRSASSRSSTAKSRCIWVGRADPGQMGGRCCSTRWKSSRMRVSTVRATKSSLVVVIEPRIRAVDGDGEEAHDRDHAAAAAVPDRVTAG